LIAGILPNVAMGDAMPRPYHADAAAGRGARDARLDADIPAD
jgi:hypothetical protein